MEGRKNSHIWSSQQQPACSEWAPKISLQLQSSTWTFVSSSAWICFLFPKSQSWKRGEVFLPRWIVCLAAAELWSQAARKVFFPSHSMRSHGKILPFLKFYLKRNL